MSLFDSTINRIDAGRAGQNKGIPIPFNRLRKYLPNIQQKTYYLLGASTKIGKTSLADDMFYYGAYDYFKKLEEEENLDGFELDIDYFSFEIDSESKIIKGINRKVWHDYGIVTDSSSILSRGENHCSDEIYQIIKGYKDYFDNMESVCTIHDEPLNPTGIYKYLWDKAMQHGTIIEKNIQADPKGEPMMRFDKYIPHNPKRYWLVFIDHIALMREERGYTTKQNIDKMSQMFVVLRNNFGLTPIVIQQLAFDSENDERHKSGRLTPTLKDFGDSKYTTRDANVIMTLFSPYSLNLEKFHGYDITRLGNSFRSLEILANRDGEPNVNVGLNFIGPCGTFRELPKASEMTDLQYKYAADYTNTKTKYMKNSTGLWVPKQV